LLLVWYALNSGIKSGVTVPYVFYWYMYLLCAGSGEDYSKLRVCRPALYVPSCL